MVEAGTILESSSLLREMEVRSLRCDYKKIKLLYGLETIHLTQAMQKKVNTVQLRGLRKILSLQSTYMNRAHTNAAVMQKANQETNRNRRNNSREIKLFSELVQQKNVN